MAERSCRPAFSLPFYGLIVTLQVDFSDKVPDQFNLLPVVAAGLIRRMGDDLFYKFIDDGGRQFPDAHILPHNGCKAGEIGLILLFKGFYRFSPCLDMLCQFSLFRLIVSGEFQEPFNNAGSRVSIIQMRFSKLKAHGIDVYTQYTHVYRTKILEYGYDYFTPQKTNVSYPIAALNPAYEVLNSGRHSNNFAPISSDTKENQLCNLQPEQLLNCFDITLEALDKVLEFVEDNKLKKHNRSDYINYLIGYFVFHREGITNEQKDSLISWYNSVDFTNKSNTARRKIYSDLLKL